MLINFGSFFADYFDLFSNFCCFCISIQNWCTRYWEDIGWIKRTWSSG